MVQHGYEYAPLIQHVGPTGMVGPREHEPRLSMSELLTIVAGEGYFRSDSLVHSTLYFSFGCYLNKRNDVYVTELAWKLIGDACDAGSWAV